MAKANNHLKDLIKRAAERENHSEARSGGDFERSVAAKGKTVGRLIEYVELGVQKQKPWQGKPRASKDTVRVTFELLGKKNIREIDVDGKTREIADRISITTNKSMHPKASFFKLFKKMQYGRDSITHMAQMLGEAFNIEITHNEVTKDGTTTVYANMQDEDGTYLIGAPVREIFDADGEVTSIEKKPVREELSDLRVFIWDEPTKETWDSLFIDGEREVKDEKGKTKNVSKNWIQEMILNAENFEGSPLELMIEGGESLPDDLDEDEDDDEEDSDEDYDDEDDADDEDTDDSDEDDSDEDTDDEDEVDEDEDEDDDDVDGEDEDEEEDEEPATVKKKPAVAKKPTAKPAAASTEKATAGRTTTAKTATKSPSKAPAKKATKAPAKTKAKTSSNLLADLGIDD